MKNVLPNLILGAASAVALALFTRWCWRDLSVEHEERHAGYVEYDPIKGKYFDPVTKLEVPEDMVDPAVRVM